MSFEVPPLSSADRALSVQPASRTEKPQPATPADSVDAVRLDTIPSQPPESLHAEIDAAAQRVDDLHDEGRELHFAYDKDSGRVQVEVRDLSGNVIRTIPPSAMLDVASGAKLD
jgi:uncharacterized FlaG/YvyC family protein